MYALREEGDITAAPLLLPLANFYPRPPRGGRPAVYAGSCCGRLFLSTPSARRATRSYHTLGGNGTDFYPRPPRGGRLRITSVIRWRAVFLSTPSARRATVYCLTNFSSTLISIHALREEGDGPGRQLRVILGNFYPRPPRGGRHLRTLQNQV